MFFRSSFFFLLSSWRKFNYCLCSLSVLFTEVEKKGKQGNLRILFVESTHCRCRWFRRGGDEPGILLIGHEVVDDDDEQEREGRRGRDR